MAVVAFYLMLGKFIDVSARFMRYLSAVMLIILAYVFFKEDVKAEFEDQHGHFHENREEIRHEHEHEHPNGIWHTHEHRHAKTVLTLLGIATFAFFLGFAHEEEFVILALAVGGADPLMLMVAYAASVAVALIGITVASIKAYSRIKHRIQRFKGYVPKISALILLLMAIALIFNTA